ncbi:MAG: hypothetical protein HYZ54_01725 [Ignavibacteriae bacterium]|nr:hypothetical protein [Ignavibacteriota bacterium]
MKTRLFFKITVIALTLAVMPFIGKSQVAGIEDHPKAKERIQQLKKIRLIDILELDEASAEKFFARYNQYQKTVEDARANLKEAVADLEKNVQSKSSKEYSRKADLVVEKQTALANAVSERLKAMKSILTEEQYAKFIVFENNFAGQLQKMLMERKQKKLDGDK